MDKRSLPLDGAQFLRKQKKTVFQTAFKTWGCTIVPINSRFIADLKRLADLKRRMDEWDELGKRLKAANSRPRK